jgi:hypothetical protein
MARRYTNPVRWELLGDVGSAQRYLPFARKLIQFEIEQMERFGIAYRANTKTYDNGLRVGYNIDGHLNGPVIVNCTVDTRLLTRDFSITGIRHGLANPKGIAKTAGGTGLNRFHPRDYVSDPSRDWITEPLFKDNAAQFGVTTPGMFSGEMRAVVQAIMSRGRLHTFSPNEADTHGIYTSADGSKWVIRISPSGIHAAQLAIVPNTGETDPDEHLASLSYDIDQTARLPDYNQRPDEWHQLTTSDQAVLDAYYDALSAPLFPECGWAFSASGALASNVVIEERTSSDNPARPAYPPAPFAQLYTITISEVANVPSSFSVVNVEGDWLYGDRVNILKYPEYGTLGSTTHNITWFDWFRNSGKPMTPGTGLDSPLYCWYEGESLQLTRYSWGTVTVDTDAIPELPALSASTLTGVGREPGSDPVTVTTYPATGFSSPLFSTPDARVNTAQYARRTRTNDYTANRAYKKGQYETPLSEDVDRILEVDATYSNTNNLFENLIIPLFDRESIGHYRNVESVETTSDSALHSTTWVDLEDSLYNPLVRDARNSTFTAYPIPFGCGVRCRRTGFTTLGTAPTYEAEWIEAPHEDPSIYRSQFSGVPAAGQPLLIKSYASVDVALQDAKDRFVAYNANTALVSLISSTSNIDIDIWINNKTETWNVIDRFGSPGTNTFIGDLEAQNVSPVGNELSEGTAIPAANPDLTNGVIDNSVAQAQLYVDGSAIPLTIYPDDTEDEWQYRTDITQGQSQWFFAAVDASGTIGPIYLEQPVSYRSPNNTQQPWDFNTFIRGPSEYPVDTYDDYIDMESSWVGNPGDFT